VALGLCAIALAYQPDSVGPRVAGIRIGMSARDVDAAHGAAIERISPAEWYVRGETYAGAPADVWVYRDSARDIVTAIRWRQDVLFVPAAPVSIGLPGLAIEESPSDEGCTHALLQIAGQVRPFTYVGPQGAFAQRFAAQLAAVGFSEAETAAMLSAGQAYAEGFESADPPSFGCNFVFRAERTVVGAGFEAAAAADVRLDWSKAHQVWRMYRMGLQVDIGRPLR
jgi:hypothetical protein